MSIAVPEDRVRASRSLLTPPVKPQRSWLAALLLAAWLAAVLPPLAARAETLVPCRLEASSYSLPNVLASAEWKVEPQGVLLAEQPNPVLSMPWRTAVHGTKSRAQIQYTVRVYRDAGFPTSPDEKWVLEWEDHVSFVAEGKDSLGGTAFDRSGAFELPLPVHYATPIRRYRVEARLEARNQLSSVLLVKPSQSEETTVDRTFFVALRPKWKESRHQTDSLIQALLLGFGRIRGLRAWQEYVEEARRAGLSPDSAEKFDGARASSVLDRLARLGSRQMPDPELRQVAQSLVDESRKLTSTLDKGSPKMKTPRGSGDYTAVARELSSRARELATTDVPRLACLQAFNGVAQAIRLDESLEALSEAAARETRSLQQLWMVQSAVELATVLSRYGQALADERKAITTLGAALEKQLGRDYKAKAWKKIEESELYRKHLPAKAPGNRRRTAELVRTLYQGLYYYLKAERYRVTVLASAAETGLGPVKDLEKLSLPDFENEVPDYPIDLQVRAERSAGLTESGGLVEYPMVFRHAGNRPREVRLQYASVEMPRGWHRSLTDASFLLRPGQTKRVVYAVATPKTAPAPDNVRTTLLAYYADQPANAHHLAFLTRMSVEGRLLDVPGPDWDQPDRLFVKALDSEDQIYPGQVATYRFLVRHEGHTRRGVKGRVVNRVPGDFIARVMPERLVLLPGREEQVMLKVTAPLTAKASGAVDWQVAFGYEDELTDPHRVRVRTSFTGLTVFRSEPVINRGQVFTYRLKPGQSEYFLTVENRGNESDTYDFAVNEPAEGWFVDFPVNHLALTPECPSAKLAFRASPPRFAEGGAFAHVGVKMTSANHPEVVTTATLTLIKGGGDQVALRPLEPRILIAPGQVREVIFVATNRSEDPIELGFKRDPRNPLPEALAFDEVPVQRMEPEAELQMPGEVTLPAGLDFHPGQVVPVGIAGYDSLGGQIVKAHAELVVAPQYAVKLRLFPEDVRRSPGLLIARLSILNTGTVREEFALFLAGKRRTWGRLSRNRVTLDPGHDTQVTLYVRVPSDVQHGQMALLEIQAKSVHNSSARSFVRVDVAP